jgi:Domain of unknown function (DUF4440)
MMLLMTVLVFIVVFCVAFSAPAQETESGILADEDNILALENKVWESLLGPKRDTIFLEQLWAPGSLAVTTSGATISAEQFMARLKRDSLASFTIHNPRVRPLSANSALIVYQVTMDATHGARELRLLHLDITTTWVRRSDKWLVQLHTETLAASPRATEGTGGKYTQ